MQQLLPFYVFKILLFDLPDRQILTMWNCLENLQNSSDKSTKRPYCGASKRWANRNMEHAQRIPVRHFLLYMKLVALQGGLKNFKGTIVELYQKELTIGKFLDIKETFGNTSFDSIICNSLEEQNISPTVIRWIRFIQQRSDSKPQ